VSTTLDQMEHFLGAPEASVVARVRETTSTSLDDELGILDIPLDARNEILSHWSTFLTEEAWVRRLAQLVTMVERDRGNNLAPLPIWDDLDDHGTSGRLLYYYVFAMAAPGLRRMLRDQGAPDDLVSETCSLLARHGEIHRQKWGSVGVDAGWWLLPVLRGEIVQVGSLEFHRTPLGHGILACEPWYDEAQQQELGEGFRYGDESLGLHIPAFIDLSPEAVDETFARARRVLGALWPCSQSRLMTLESWMMDDRLAAALGPESRIVQFQQRFTFLPTWHDDRDNVLEFVFRQPLVPFEELRPQSRLQSFILETLKNGDWHSRLGWIHFDGPEPRRAS
jgi:hypothetical protein